MSNPVADGWKNYLHYFAKLGREVDQMKENIDIQVGTKKSKETWNKTYKFQELDFASILLQFKLNMVNWLFMMVIQLHI